MKHMPMMPEYKEPTVSEMVEDRKKYSDRSHMDHHVNAQIRNHDINGVETHMIQPDGWGECYGDGQGNNVAHGDQSVLRMVETGVRDERYLTPLDTGKK